MSTTLNDTPSGQRLHIGVFGGTNSGKSSFINAFTKRQISITSEVARTTTDPVFKAMEIYPLGPCVLIDTAGFDDERELGQLRINSRKRNFVSFHILERCFQKLCRNEFLNT